MALNLGQFKALKPQWEIELARKRKEEGEAADRLDQEWGEEIDKHPIGIGRGRLIGGNATD